MVETENLENDFIEVWLYSNRLQCTKPLESGAPCHYYSMETELTATQWKSLNYEVDNFGFQPGYYYRVLIEKYWLDLDPIEIFDEDGETVLEVVELEPQRRIRIKTVFQKLRDYKTLFSGNWKLVHVEGAEDILLTDLDKSYTVDPLHRKMRGKYLCHDLEIALNDFLDLNRIDLSDVSIEHQACDPDKKYLETEDLILAMFNKVKRYTLEDGDWVLKDSAGKELLRFSRNSRAP